MKICKTLDQLFEEILGYLFGEFTSLADIGQEVSACTKLHYKTNVLACFKGIVQSYNTRMIALLKDSEFLHNLFLLGMLTIFVLLFHSSLWLFILVASQKLFVD